jgi:hypothetical protein
VLKLHYYHISRSHPTTRHLFNDADTASDFGMKMHENEWKAVSEQFDNFILSFIGSGFCVIRPEISGGSYDKF